MTKLLQFVRDDSGATAIEYGLIAAGISVAIVAIVGLVGDALVSTFTTVEAAL
jgi:pilus assembly protein Flp/PilA